MAWDLLLIPIYTIIYTSSFVVSMLHAYSCGRTSHAVLVLLFGPPVQGLLLSRVLFSTEQIREHKLRIVSILVLQVMVVVSVSLTHPIACCHLYIYIYSCSRP
ncbi:hypothetical protein Micbo1qcDRAFT_163951 [Microdochium bolleyi]|uniref:Uncharacterized protein n=1 Tax=Microdochium bolleyi TaxID=196109 RepID=A0A136J1Z1_9PEZI|nr:hypothetical protein Micbo1qcDRAFT_163951 [Microdochium bolleyi]